MTGTLDHPSADQRPGNEPQEITRLDNAQFIGGQVFQCSPDGEESPLQAVTDKQDRNAEKQRNNGGQGSPCL